MKRKFALLIIILSLLPFLTLNNFLSYKVMSQKKNISATSNINIAEEKDPIVITDINVVRDSVFNNNANNSSYNGLKLRYT